MLYRSIFWQNIHLLRDGEGEKLKKVDSGAAGGDDGQGCRAGIGTGQVGRAGMEGCQEDGGVGGGAGGGDGAE